MRSETALVSVSGRLDLHLIINVLSIYEGYYMDDKRNGFGRYTGSLQINVLLKYCIKIINVFAIGRYYFCY